MSTEHTAYLFIGAPVPRSHFCTENVERYKCHSHGARTGRYCNQCGYELTPETITEWTEAMQLAASHYNHTAKQLWETINPGGGFCYSGDSHKVGFWRFGYTGDHELFGRPIATTYASWGDPHVTPEELQKALSAVDGVFKVFGIEEPPLIHVVLDMF